MGSLPAEIFFGGRYIFCSAVLLAAYARRTYFTEATTRPVARHRGIGPSLGQTLLALARYTYRRIEDAHYARQLEIRCRRHKSRLGNMVACNTLDEFVRSTIDVGLGQV